MSPSAQPSRVASRLQRHVDRGGDIVYAPTDDEWWEFDFTRPTVRGEVLIVAHDLTSGGGQPEKYVEWFYGFVARRLVETRP